MDPHWRKLATGLKCRACGLFIRRGSPEWFKAHACKPVAKEGGGR